MPIKPIFADPFHYQRRLISCYHNLIAYLLRPLTALKMYMDEVARLREQIQQPQGHECEASGHSYQT